MQEFDAKDVLKKLQAICRDYDVEFDGWGSITDRHGTPLLEDLMVSPDEATAIDSQNARSEIAL
ncbi:hypothetical protein [Deinococcus peraridilitoris]|uniref:Uncharacterized protein n=1 Tax=Deinococcus peraridilitoris (strain DSM 19664 / LMG 22246 / CIP 109416 / KR-200) TaxID=937777 RepID=L0A3M8_DEIPD|nr:hypothetical protein [Deinococcus peraridilitoris]AFZ67595.1 hypothetical protein Deipe_2100 [Deinococcus peraridilitoris DSM 19664]